VKAGNHRFPRSSKSKF